MARKLAKNVWVDGKLYGPDGEEPSKEVAEQITNPKAWDAEAPAADEPAYPEGDPSEDWKGDQLDAYARDNSVDLSGAKTKADKVAAIQAAASA